MSLMATRQELLVPPLWEIEWRVVQIACEVMGFDRSRATPESRLLEDLGMDSLDLIDFMMRLEAEFLITLPKQACQGWFVNQPATLRRVAELVIAHWGTGKPDRGRWFRRAVPPAVVDSCPSTQLDGRLRPREWLDGQLYELLGLNR